MADVNVHISLGGPRAVAYHPIYHSGYFYNTAYAPSLLFVPYLGFYVSVGLPYDLVFFNNYYYVYHSGYWYHSPYYRGPWVVVKHNRLPHIIRKHRWHKIRDYCDREYRRHAKHRWLKHPRNVYKKEHKKIRQRAYYDDDQQRHWRKVYREKPERERQKAYKVRPEHEKRKAYRVRTEQERRKAYKARSEDERRKAYKIRTEPKKRVIYKERKKTKTWRKNSGERIAVKEKTTKTKLWTKQDNNRNEKQWVKQKVNAGEIRHTERHNKFRNERKGNYKGVKVERETKRWGKGYASK